MQSPEDSLAAATDTALMSRPDCMIRIYLFVEWDYMLDVISLLSARVSCTSYKADPPSVPKSSQASLTTTNNALKKKEN